MVEQHTATLNGQHVHYSEVRGQGPALVLLHGITGSHNTFSPFLSTLAGSAHLYVPDLRGHNLSGHAANAYRLSDYGHDLASFLREIVSKPAFVVGHSLGGMIAIWLAAQEAAWVRGIFLEDPPVYITQPPRLRESPLYPLLDGLRTMLHQHHASGGTLEGLATTIGQWPMPDGSSMLEAIGHDAVWQRATELQRMDPAALDIALAGSDMVGRPIGELLSLIRCPTHLLAADFRMGGAMHALDVAEFLHDVPQSTHDVIEGVGHGIHEERPVEFVNSLQQVLARWQAET